MGAGASAGAAVGNAIAPGIGGAVGGLFGSFLDGGKSVSAPAGPLTASTAVYGSGQDASGWNVNFGGTQTSGSNKAGNPGLSETLGLGAGGLLPGLSMPSLGGISTTYLLIGAALVAVIVWKKSKSK